MENIIDIHCHILPYVDDGAEHLSDSMELISEEIAQGVSAICFTPHLRMDMFESTDDTIRREFEDIQKHVAEEKLPIALYLGREYHYDRQFQQLLQRKQLIPLGNSNTILMEFSQFHPYEKVLFGVRQALDAGYQPLIAHVERYPDVVKNIDSVHRLVEEGAWIQVNAGSILGREGFRQKRIVRKLLKEKLVTVAASDTHDMEYRPPELKRCADYLEHKIDREYARWILHDNPLKALNL